MTDEQLRDIELGRSSFVVDSDINLLYMTALKVRDFSKDVAAGKEIFYLAPIHEWTFHEAHRARGSHTFPLWPTWSLPRNHKAKRLKVLKGRKA